MPLLMSKQAFSRLSSEQQNAVRTAARKAIERQRAEVAKNEKALIEVERLNARENQIMSKACIVIYALMATAAAWYWFFGRGMKLSGQHGGEL